MGQQDQRQLNVLASMLSLLHLKTLLPLLSGGIFVLDFFSVLVFFLHIFYSHSVFKKEIVIQLVPSKEAPGIIDKRSRVFKRRNSFVHIPEVKIDNSFINNLPYLPEMLHLQLCVIAFNFHFLVTKKLK